MRCKTVCKATTECKNYRKSISSLEALRPLLSGALLPRKRKRSEFVCWSDCSILLNEQMSIISKFMAWNWFPENDRSANFRKLTKIQNKWQIARRFQTLVDTTFRTKHS